MAAQYLVKRRTFEMGARNRFARGGQTYRYGKWQTLDSQPGLRQAEEALEKWSKKGGLYDWGIFYRGLRIKTPSEGIQR